MIPTNPIMKVISATGARILPDSPDLLLDIIYPFPVVYASAEVRCDVPSVVFRYVSVSAGVLAHIQCKSRCLGGNVRAPIKQESD